jgi:hypothetical protein
VKLLVAMTDKASAAKTASGDEPVFAYMDHVKQYLTLLFTRQFGAT